METELDDEAAGREKNCLIIKLQFFNRMSISMFMKEIIIEHLTLFLNIFKMN